ncbi:hypothetical protein Tco_0968168 [Tanacetum coccineum]
MFNSYDVIRLSFESDLPPFKECATCGVVYTADFCCSKKGLEDKILVLKPTFRNLSKVCKARCGNPVDGRLSQGMCSFTIRNLRKIWVFSTYYVENEFFKDLQDTSDSSDDNTNVVNAPQEPFVGASFAVIIALPRNSFYDSKFCLVEPSSTLATSSIINLQFPKWSFSIIVMSLGANDNPYVYFGLVKYTHKKEEYEGKAKIAEE